jgi:hypothetical protein
VSNGSTRTLPARSSVSLTTWEATNNAGKMMASTTANVLSPAA